MTMRFMNTDDISQFKMENFFSNTMASGLNLSTREVYRFEINLNNIISSRLW